jgi:hypothetical protein
MPLLLEALVLVMPICLQERLGVLTGPSSLTPGRGGRQDRQTGGKILPAHIYRKEEE